MFTLIQGHDTQTVKVSTQDGDVEVKVASDAPGLPAAPLTRAEAHEALIEAKEKAEDFIAAVEGDIEATAA